MHRRGFIGSIAVATVGGGCLRLQNSDQGDAGEGSAGSDGGQGQNVVRVGDSGDGSETWPSQRFDSANTAYNPDGTVPREVPEVIGSVDVGVSLTTDGLLGGGSAYFSTADQTIVAIDAETGEQQWSGGTETPPIVPEAIVNQDILAARAVDGTVYSLDRSTGETDEGFDFGYNGIGLTRNPETNLWVAPALDGWVRGVNPPERTVEWESPVGGAAMRAAVDGSIAVVSVIRDVDPDAMNFAEPSEMDAGGLLYVLDVESGERLAQSSREHFGVAAPVLGPDRLYWAGFGGDIVARSREDGEEVWRFSSNAGSYRSPALADGMLVFGTEGDTVYGVDAASGEEEWSFSADARLRGGPIGVDQTVCLGSDAGSTYAVDLQTGDLRWRFEAEESVRSLTAGGGRVHVGTGSAIHTLGTSG